MPLPQMQSEPLHFTLILVNIFTNVNTPFHFEHIIFEISPYFAFREVDTVDYQDMIRNLREDSDLTQQDVAEILGTSQTMYARYERGANEMPIRHLLKLCEYYHVSADYILGLSSSSGGADK